MKTILDPGHWYELLQIDGIDRRYDELRFVKRHDPANPKRFPGNTSSNPGTTLQSVIRCLLDRVGYLQNQIWCPENALIRPLLRVCLWLLEFRAGRRHGKLFLRSIKFASSAPMCPLCGHTVCKHGYGI